MGDVVERKIKKLIEEAEKLNRIYKDRIE